MILSAVYVLVVAQSSSEVPEGLMNNPVYYRLAMHGNLNMKYLNIKYLNIVFCKQFSEPHH